MRRNLISSPPLKFFLFLQKKKKRGKLQKLKKKFENWGKRKKNPPLIAPLKCLKNPFPQKALNFYFFQKALFKLLGKMPHPSPQLKPNWENLKF